jgi:bidirectional [NiFe] hydrogenase diaphorase subunit
MTTQPRVITLRIDHHELSAREDETILQVARDNGIFIPTLCCLEGLTAWGSCRLCLVEVNGSRRLVAACAARVAQDMDIKTDTPRILAHRKMILELLFSERNHVCSVCVANGHCELQLLAQVCGVDHVRLRYRYPELPLDASHELFRLDPNRCIVCTRCVRVCDEIEGAHTWDVMGRGIDCQVITDLKTPWGESESCTSCGKCVHVCPTGALSKHGTATAEVHRHRDFLPYLTLMRGERD